MAKPWDRLIKDSVKIIVSFFVLTICALVIFGNYPDEYIKWALGMIGVIVGYWLK